MQKVFKAYMNRPWPTKTSKNRRSSTDNNLPRFGPNCTCQLYAECQQNAAAYISAAKYSKDHPEAIDTTFKANKSIKRKTNQCPKKHLLRIKVFHGICLIYGILHISILF